jgi:hypothetical protein
LGGNVGRRSFIASLGSAAALAACSGDRLGALVPSDNLATADGVAHASSTTLTVVNSSTKYADAQVWYYVWGRDTATGTFRYLLPDGTTKQWTTAVGNDFGIALSQKASVTLPKLVAAEIYVSLGSKPNFLNGQPAQQEPVAPNAWTPNAYGDNFKKLFDHIEYTYINDTLGVNTTTVDMLSLPFTFTLTAGGKNHTYGFKPNAKISDLYAEFAAVPNFKNLLIPGGKGKYLRVIAPGHGIENQQMGLAHGFPPGYLSAYIDACWQQYKTTALSVFTDDGRTLLATGKVNASGAFVFTNVKGRLVEWTDPATGKHWTGFPKPTSLGAFECAANEIPSPSNSGEPVDSMTNVFGACGKNIGASINRTVLNVSKKQPYCQEAQFYKNPKTNHYAKILHEYAIDGKFYGFAYDDLCGYSNYVAFDKVSRLKLVVGSLA